VKLAKAELKKRIEAWWKIAPPKTKRTVILAGCLLVLGLMMFFSSIFMPSEKKQAKKEQAPQVEVMSKRTRSQLYESASVRRLRGRVDSLEKSVDKVKKDIGEINKTISDIKKSVTISQDQIKVFQTQLIQKAGKLEEIISKAQREKTKKSKKAEKEQKTEKKVPTFSDIWGRSTQEDFKGKYPLGKGEKKEWKKSPQPRLKAKNEGLVGEIKESSSGPTEETAGEKSITIRIPAGSFFRGILLNGVDAPVALSAKKNPYPVLIKVKTEAWLPNEYRYDIKGCYIVAAAWGDMSSERTYFRTERFSCVRRNGGVVEAQLDASVIDGQDGKLGVFGKLVSKQGQIIARSLVAGLASGFAEALSPRRSFPVFDTDSDNEDYYVTPPLGTTLRYGVFSGLGEAANKIADFYLKMAEQVFPVVEVQAGTPVEVFLLRGLNLTIKKIGKDFKNADTTS